MPHLLPDSLSRLHLPFHDCRHCRAGLGMCAPDVHALAGMFDAQDGPATAEAWLKSLPWTGIQAFQAAPRLLWRPDLNLLRGAQQVPDLASALPILHAIELLDQRLATKCIRSSRFDAAGAQSQGVRRSWLYQGLGPADPGEAADTPGCTSSSLLWTTTVACAGDCTELWPYVSSRPASGDALNDRDLGSIHPMAWPKAARTSCACSVITCRQSCCPALVKRVLVEGGALVHCRDMHITGLHRLTQAHLHE